MSSTLTVLCPMCSGLLQVTRIFEVYYTYKNGKWETVDATNTDTRYYCENDCVIDLETVNLPELPNEELQCLQNAQLPST